MAHLGWSGHPSAEGRAVPHVPVGMERGWGPRPSLLSGHSRVFAALNRGRANPSTGPARHPRVRMGSRHWQRADTVPT